MKIYPGKSQFGWENDDGIGERLIQQIMSGNKTATASPKALCSPDELEELFDSRGQFLTVIDKYEKPRCNIRILDVFETTFGKPDPRLIAGEGYGTDVKAFQDSHHRAWDESFAKNKLQLCDDTVLITELFELSHTD
jgi:uncharacterized protein YhfF